MKAFAMEYKVATLNELRGLSICQGILFIK